MAYSRTLNHFTSMQELATIWASSTSYVVNQLVIESDKLYRCLVAHTSGGTFIADLQAAYWVEISASEAGVFNYIGNPDAEVDASGWTTYAESDSVTFTDAGDLVTLNNHGLSNGNEISFTSITSTTGISVNTRYFVVSATTNTFQVASSSGGSALPLTTNGSGTMVRFVPKTGSGGSPNITWSRSITSPLRGDADFNLVKDAANRQGQGVEYDFTIDNADLAKVLTVTFDYEVVSGTLATGDVTVYLIQDPSGTPLVIQPAGYQVQGATVGTKMRQIATFQTSSTVTSYRLCLHVSSVSATAYTLAVDNVVVGPQVVQYGAPVTDWQSYTPTVSTGTWTNRLGWWRRVGDSMEVVMYMGPCTANGSGLYTFSLPSGFSIDTTGLKQPSVTPVIPDTANAQYTLSAPIGIASLSTNDFWYMDGGTSFADARVQAVTSTTVAIVTGGTTANRANALGAADNFSSVAGIAQLSFTVPILGWSSTVQMSNDTDTRVVAFRGYLATNTAVTADVTKIPYTTTVDTHGAWSSANSTYTVPVPGQYEILSRALSISSGGYIRVYRNGSFFAYLQNFYSAQLLSGSFLGNFNAGDVLDFRSTGSVTLTGDADINTAITIKRLSGPSAIAASETVAAKYYVSVTNTPGANLPINFDTRIKDTHGSVTVGAGWRFTAPVSGAYNVSTHTYQDSATNFQIRLFKNGSAHENLYYSGTGGAAFSGSTLIDLLAGEYIDIRPDAAGGIRGSAGVPYLSAVSIHRIGN